jgi:CheY-like chemotaxis protein
MESNIKAESPPLPQGLTLLVVEDDDDIRELAVSIFQQYGADVHQARHGREALDILQRTPAITLLFTDMHMPVMAGDVLISEALKLRPQLKIVATTGYASAARLARHLPLVRKPYRINDLLMTFRRVLGLDGGNGSPVASPSP